MHSVNREGTTTDLGLKGKVAVVTGASSGICLSAACSMSFSRPGGTGTASGPLASISLIFRRMSFLSLHKKFSRGCTFYVRITFIDEMLSTPTAARRTRPLTISCQYSEMFIMIIPLLRTPMINTPMNTPISLP